MPDRKCETCRWWSLIDGTESGHCRRHAPTARVCDGPDFPMTHWARTDSTDWCGEWAKKEVKPDD